MTGRGWLTRRNFDFDPVEQRLLIRQTESALFGNAGQNKTIFIIQNWTERLKRLVPLD